MDVIRIQLVDEILNIQLTDRGIQGPPGVAPDETDPIFSAWNKSTGISITESQISDLQVYALASHDHAGLYAVLGHTHDYTLVFAAIGHNHSGVYDPTGTASGLLSTHESTYSHANIVHGETAYNWGDHAGLYSLLAHTHTQLHDAVTVASLPLTLSGQQITFNYDTNDFQLSGNNFQVKDLGIDHGGIGGLSDDDHSQYLLLGGRTESQTILAYNTTTKGLILKGVASQSVNILEFQDSSGNVIHNFPIHTGSEIVFNEQGNDINIRIEGGGNANAFFLDAGTGNIGIGQAATDQVILDILATNKRYGINIFQTAVSTMPYPCIFDGTLITQIATQGMGMNFQVYSIGTTVPEDFLVGINTFVFQQRNIDVTGINTMGFNARVYCDIAGDGTINVGNFYGAYFVTGMGHASSGTGIKTAFDAAGIIAGPIKNGPSAGTVIFTNFASIKSDQDIVWQGTGSFTITNNRGIWVTEVDRGINNINILLGDTGAIGNWSIYNTSSYNSLLSSLATKLYIRDIGIYLASLDDSYLDIVADGAVRIGGLLMSQNLEPLTDNIYYLGKNSITAPKAYKGVVFKDTINGNYYRVEIINSVITATQIT